MWTAVYFLLGWDATESSTKMRRFKFHPSFSHLPYNSAASLLSCSCLPTWDRKYHVISLQSALKHKDGSIQMHYWHRLRSLLCSKVWVCWPFHLKDRVSVRENNIGFKFPSWKSLFTIWLHPLEPCRQAHQRKLQKPSSMGCCPALRPAPVIGLTLHQERGCGCNPSDCYASFSFK